MNFLYKKTRLKQSFFIIRILINHKNYYICIRHEPNTVTLLQVVMDLSLTYSIPISEQTGRKNKIKGDNYTSIILIISTTGEFVRDPEGTPNLYTNTNPKASVWFGKKQKKCKVMKSEADFGFYMYVCYDRPLVTLICIPKTNKQKFGHVLEFGHRMEYC